jgi:hypothetical protein
MRVGVPILLLLGIMGCASQHADVEKPPAVAQLARPAGALAFDPPVSLQLADEVLARGPRQPAAFVGYDETSIVYSYIQTDDRQILFDRFNHYDRRAIITRLGVSYR